MTDPTFRAAVAASVHPEAQALVTAYDRTPGSVGPYCCPQALAAALDALADDAAEVIGLCGSISVIEFIRHRAAQLRGEQ